MHKRTALIRQHPCFSQLTNEEIEKLASLFLEKYFKAKSTIVTEGELVNSIYFIMSGKAEVRHILTHEYTIQPIPSAILTEGETIGLNDTGFYSATGKRTATVVALTDMELLRLDLAAFYQFAHSNPHVSEIMRNSTDILLRMNLIKQAAPFTKISVEKIRKLAEQVTRISVEAGKIIFQKGNPGDQCYLIQTGKVEIFIPNPDGSETRLAVLKPPMIFGEAALLMNMPRNASARALKTSQLLAIHLDLLSQIVSAETNVASSLMALLKTRSRPIQLPYIESHILKEADQEMIITLKDTLHDEYFRLSEEGWFIWQLLNGKRSLRDITLAFYREYDIFDPGLVSTFIMDLEQAGFVEKNLQKSEKRNAPSRWMKSIMRIRQIMEASISFGGVDEWLTKSYRNGVFVLYTFPIRTLLAVLAILGLGIFVARFHHNVELLHSTPHSGWLIIAAIVASMAGAILHELGHAYTTKAFGRKVKSFGVGWYWLGPIAFCDTSDMWLSPKGPRIAVDLAGLYVDVLLAALVSIIALFFVNPYIVLFLWLLALFNYIEVLFNLSPMLELDGYYTLMDLSGKDNLRESAITWLIEDLPKNWRHPALLWKSKAELSYWVISLFFLIMEAIIPYIIMKFLLYGLLGIQNPIYSLVIALIAVILSSLSIWGEIQEQRRSS